MEALVERVVVADGVALHVERRVGVGDRSGASFLLVHGLASNLHLWDAVAEALAGSGHAVAAVDQRGHGRSDKPDGGYDVVTVTDDLAAVVEVLGYDRPVLVGQSWGANVVLEAAWRFPGLARGVACVDGGWIELRRRFGDWSACEAALRPPATSGRPASEIKRWLRQSHPDWSEVAIDATMACFEHRDDGTVTPWLSLEHHLAVLRGMWEHSPSSHYAEVDVPVLLVPAASSPERSSHAAAEVDGAVAALRRCRVQWMAGDHDLHAHHPDELAAMLHGAIVSGFFP